jgi:hypothetical protein
MTSLALADWTTAQPLSLPDLGPGLEEGIQLRLEAVLRLIAADCQMSFCSWRRALPILRVRPRWPAGGVISGFAATSHLVDLVVSGSADAAWHGVLLVAQP